MATCGTFAGPSVTGGVHLIECTEPLYGKFVTVKIVVPNYIRDDPISSSGRNCLVLGEAVISGILA
jgi:hypothetical protein